MASAASSAPQLTTQPHAPQVLIMVEGIYSMEGEPCPLAAIVAVKQKYKVRRPQCGPSRAWPASRAPPPKTHTRTHACVCVWHVLSCGTARCSI